MKCYHCQSPNLKCLKKKTALGYQQYIYEDCGKQFNERTVQHLTGSVAFSIFNSKNRNRNFPRRN